MRCEECGSFQVSVKDSRVAGSTRMVAGKERKLTPMCVEKHWGKNFIWRKRQCSNCNHKWSTVEISISKEGYAIKYTDIEST